MARDKKTLDPEIARLWLTPLPPDEFMRRYRAIATADLTEGTELARWFLRRYPTAQERLAYVRRKYAALVRAGAREEPDDPDA